MGLLSVMAMFASLSLALTAPSSFHCKELLLDSLQQFRLLRTSYNRHANSPLGKTYVSKQAIGFFVRVDKVSTIQVKSRRSHFLEGNEAPQYT